MSGVWGKNIKLSIFGESHGKAIGIDMDGLPPGIEIDMDFVRKEMLRRKAAKDRLSTSRSEDDDFEILSGFFNGRTTGTPLLAVIKNNDMHPEDYSKMETLMRPGHSDYTGYVKYRGYNDYRGGGHFSGRITAPLVFAGAVAKQLLGMKNILIGSHIKSIGNIQDTSFDPVNIEGKLLEALTAMDFPVLDEKTGEIMKEAIFSAKKEGNSLGGVIECAAINIPEGVGSPFFDSVESVLSHLLFSIPAVKGVEFGAGFGISGMKGSQANDQYYMESSKVRAYTNNNGGILGGITDGMPLIFRAAVKPTPSISIEQRTVDIKAKKDAVISVKGRHDPCIVPRAVPVAEGACALAILDLMMEMGSIWEV